MRIKVLSNIIEASIFHQGERYYFKGDMDSIFRDVSELLNVKY
ncbi:hypothetical protein [Cetobacterium sp.]